MKYLQLICLLVTICFCMSNVVELDIDSLDYLAKIDLSQLPENFRTLFDKLRQGDGRYKF